MADLKNKEDFKQAKKELKHLFDTGQIDKRDLLWIIKQGETDEEYRASQIAKELLDEHNETH